MSLTARVGGLILCLLLINYFAWSLFGWPMIYCMAKPMFGQLEAYLQFVNFTLIFILLTAAFVFDGLQFAARVLLGIILLNVFASLTGAAFGLGATCTPTLAPPAKAEAAQTIPKATLTRPKLVKVVCEDGRQFSYTAARPDPMAASRLCARPEPKTATVELPPVPVPNPERVSRLAAGEEDEEPLDEVHEPPSILRRLEPHERLAVLDRASRHDVVYAVNGCRGYWNENGEERLICPRPKGGFCYLRRTGPPYGRTEEDC